MTLQPQTGGRSTIIRNLWHSRRWLYAAYMLVAVLRIPARVHFRLLVPKCDTRLTLVNARLSMTKVPHIVLFAVFFVFTLLQFDQLNPRAFRWSLLATAALGLLVELEEGASRTGNCRVTDVLPDVVGAAIAATMLLATLTLRRSPPRPNAPTE
jgi:hypothetical protein